MGRSPNSKSNEGLNRGAWTVIEDQILTNYIKNHGEGRWRKIAKETGLKRCGKSCRLRWLNYLRPDIKRGNISQDEEDLIIRLHRLLGNRWSLIAGRLPGRTDNEIKNYWNSNLGKKVQAKYSKQSKREDPIKEPSNEAAPSPKTQSHLTKAKPRSCGCNDGVSLPSLLDEYLGINTLVKPSVSGVLEKINGEAESDFSNEILPITCNGDDNPWDFMMDLSETQISLSEVLQTDLVKLCEGDVMMVQDFSNDYKNWSMPSSLDENHLFSQELL